MRLGVKDLRFHYHMAISIWKEICTHDLVVLAQVRWLLGDETFVYMSQSCLDF